MSKAGNVRSLGILDRIYRFSGGLRSPGEVDIARPVTVVHDVSRSAALERGFFFEDQTLTLVVALSTTDRASLFRDDVLDSADAELKALGLPRSEVDVWWMRTRLYALSTANNLNFALIGWGNGFANSRSTLIGTFSKVESVSLDGTTDLPLSLESNSTLTQPTTIGIVPNPWPILLRSGRDDASINLLISSTSGGNLDVRVHNVFWIGPKDVDPPPFSR